MTTVPNTNPEPEHRQWCDRNHAQAARMCDHEVGAVNIGTGRPLLVELEQGDLDESPKVTMSVMGRYGDVTYWTLSLDQADELRELLGEATELGGRLPVVDRAKLAAGVALFKYAALAADVEQVRAAAAEALDDDTRNRQLILEGLLDDLSRLVGGAA